MSPDDPSIMQRRSSSGAVSSAQKPAAAPRRTDQVVPANKMMSTSSKGPATPYKTR